SPRHRSAASVWCVAGFAARRSARAPRRGAAVSWYAHPDGEAVRAITRIDSDGPLVARLRNYFYTPDVIAEICGELALPFRSNGYGPGPCRSLHPESPHEPEAVLSPARKEYGRGAAECAQVASRRRARQWSAPCHYRRGSAHDGGWRPAAI